MVLTVPELDSTILDYLKHDGLLQEGHFQYPSGRHSTFLLDYDRLLADPQAASRMGYALAKAFFTAKIDTVAAPSIWGGGLAQWVAYFLEPRAKVVYAPPEPDGTRRIADNLHGLIVGKRILLVDNVTFSGQTIHTFDQAITGLGGEVVGIGCLWAGSDADNTHRAVFGLLNARYPAFEPVLCPACLDGDDDIQILSI